MTSEPIEYHLIHANLLLFIKTFVYLQNVESDISHWLTIDI